MTPVIPVGPAFLVLGLVICVTQARGYIEHRATPPVELALGAHPLWMHVAFFAGGVLCTLAGVLMAVDEHRERKQDREEERMWEERYERTPPVPPHGRVVR